MFARMLSLFSAPILPPNRDLSAHPAPLSSSATVPHSSMSMFKSQCSLSSRNMLFSPALAPDSSKLALPPRSPDLAFTHSFALGTPPSPSPLSPSENFLFQLLPAAAPLSLPTSTTPSDSPTAPPVLCTDAPTTSSRATPDPTMPSPSSSRPFMLPSPSTPATAAP
uniref:Uncharacterized protein n=1 Tax=Physcomitrium patens TaxID=3218 RepID=A0A2K1IUA8_PHYPA|nr:hypothetical protein PHYPA_024802 [Physcomitrium patens]